MTDPLTRLALEASSDKAAKRILEGGQAYAGQGLPADTRTGKLDPDSPLGMALRGVHYEVSPAEREDIRRRDRYDDYVDPWGYPDPPLEPRDED